MKYSELLNRRANTHTIPYKLLCLDPGDTMGVAMFYHGELKERSQMLTTLPSLGRRLERMFDDFRPSEVVCESYRVYSNKAKQHINSDVPTLRLIGRIEHICEVRNIPLHFQSASEGKGFATDAILTKLEVVQVNRETHSERHSLDAVRHGIHYILFG